MFHTAEVRWFYPGDLPGDLLAWFSAGQHIPAEERTDRYLIFPGCETVGVKIRAGQFEIKARRGGSETVRFAGNVSGRTDCWVKWSHSQPDHDWLQMMDLTQQRWVAVTKTRQQRLYRLDQEQIQEVDPDGASFGVGTVELTRILVANALWWTLALEASGEPTQVRGMLQRIGETFFSQHPPLYRFDTTCSCAYPTWLGSL